MKKLIVGISAATAALAIAGCSASATAQPSPFEVFIRNVTAAQCANPSAAMANIPLVFVTQAQALQAVEGVCAGIYGTVAAPVSASGMQPAIPGPAAAPTTVVPSPAPVAATPAVK